MEERASARIICIGWRRCCAEAVEGHGLTHAYEKIDLPLAAVLADVEREGIRVDPKALDAMSVTMEKEVRRLEKEIWDMAGVEFNVNSPTQLAEVLFDKLNLQAPFRRGKGRVRSTAADVLEDLANQHPMPAKVIEFREIVEAEEHVCGFAAETDFARRRGGCTRAFRRRARRRGG